MNKLHIFFLILILVGTYFIKADNNILTFNSSPTNDSSLVLFNFSLSGFGESTSKSLDSAYSKLSYLEYQIRYELDELDIILSVSSYNSKKLHTKSTSVKKYETKLYTQATTTKKFDNFDVRSIISLLSFLGVNEFKNVQITNRREEEYDKFYEEFHKVREGEYSEEGFNFWNFTFWYLWLVCVICILFVYNTKPLLKIIKEHFYWSKVVCMQYIPTYLYENIQETNLVSTKYYMNEKLVANEGILISGVIINSELENKSIENVVEIKIGEKYKFVDCIININEDYRFKVNSKINGSSLILKILGDFEKLNYFKYQAIFAPNSNIDDFKDYFSYPRNIYNEVKIVYNQKQIRKDPYFYSGWGENRKNAFWGNIVNLLLFCIAILGFVFLSESYFENRSLSVFTALFLFYLVLSYGMGKIKLWGKVKNRLNFYDMMYKKSKKYKQIKEFQKDFINFRDY